MASRKTWIWIVVGVTGAGVACLIVVAGAGVYFVSHHISTSRATSAEAIRAIEAVTSSFTNQQPLLEADNGHTPRVVRPIGQLPTSTATPTDLWILAWEPDEQRVVKVSVPFWVLRVGRQKMRVVRGETGFDFEQLNLDVRELERVGPQFVLDFRNRDGVRVLLWTR